MLTLTPLLLVPQAGWSQENLSEDDVVPPTASISESNQTQSNPIESNRTQLNHIDQGRLLYQQRQWEAAIAIWQEALQTPGSQQNALEQAAAWTYLGMAYQKVGNWEAAQTAISTALQQLEAAPTNANERSHLLAQALNARGHLELTQGRLDRAVTTWQQVTEVYQDIGYESGVTGSLMNQARALEVNGYYRRACRVLLDAIDLNTLSCDVENPPDADQVVQGITALPDQNLQLLALRSLGNIFRLKGYLSQAHQLLHVSLRLAEELGSPQHIGFSLLNLAHVEEAQYQQATFLADRSGRESDRQDAIQLAHQALDHYSAVDDVFGISARESLELSSDTVHHRDASDRLLIFQAAVHQFDFLMRFDHWLASQDDSPERANIQAQLRIQEQAIAHGVMDDLPPSHASVYNQINLARSLLQRWRDQTLPNPPSLSSPPPSSSNITLQNLLLHIQVQADTLQDTQAQSYALGTQGQFYEILAQHTHQAETWQQAQALTQQALNLAQANQAWHIAYQWQWQLGRIYRVQGQTDAAIAHYQAAVSTLNTVRQDLVAVESQVQFSFRDTVEPVYREFVALLVEPPDGSVPNQTNLQLAIEEIDALQLSELENFLSCNLTQTVALNESQSDAQAAIVYPIILPDELAVIIRLPQSDDLQFHAIAISSDEATQQLKQLRQEVERRFLTDAFFELSSQVYDWLIRPFETVLNAQHIKTLVFLADGVIRNVPMSALYNGNTFLLEDYAIALNPGLTLPASTPLTDLNLDVIAFGLSDIRQDFPPHKNFSPLFNVENELVNIKTEVESSRELLNEDFTGTTLQDWVSRFDSPVVHLATHGQFSSNPDDTFLLAWDRRVTLADLGNILQQREDQNTDAIELLVLSACKTADGDDRATLGLSGIAIQSGARSTIGSLWYVDDQATSELMGRLYQELTNPEPGMTRAEALRRAQVDLLKSPGYQAPMFWAPYVLVGNWQ